MSSTPIKTPANSLTSRSLQPFQFKQTNSKLYSHMKGHTVFDSLRQRYFTRGNFYSSTHFSKNLIVLFFFRTPLCICTRFPLSTHVWIGWLYSPAITNRVAMNKDVQPLQLDTEFFEHPQWCWVLSVRMT